MRTSECAHKRLLTLSSGGPAAPRTAFGPLFLAAIGAKSPLALRRQVLRLQVQLDERGGLGHRPRTSAEQLDAMGRGSRGAWRPRGVGEPGVSSAFHRRTGRKDMNFDEEQMSTMEENDEKGPQLGRNTAPGPTYLPGAAPACKPRCVELPGKAPGKPSSSRGKASYLIFKRIFEVFEPRSMILGPRMPKINPKEAEHVPFWRRLSHFQEVSCTFWVFELRPRTTCLQSTCPD